MQNKDYCIIITTTDSKKTAELLINELFASKLVACIHMDKITSYFSWQFDIKNVTELRLTIKAATKNYAAIEEMIKDNHNYQLPQIVRIDIDGYKPYLEWIKSVSD